MERKELKQVLIVRTDLDLLQNVGKLCSQVAHASLSAALKCQDSFSEKLDEWLSQGGKKIVLKCKNRTELLTLKQNASKKGLITSLVKDRGLTVVKPGTLTCLGIGPDYSKQIDKVTGHLTTL